jgi:EAL domain-containing protein (putative c-di-GMP-specific phosphodiesterase class I)
MLVQYLSKYLIFLAYRSDLLNPINSTTKTILLIEDDQNLSELYTHYLNNQYNVTPAYNGQQGLQLALTLQPDLILSDIHLPETDGYELLRSLLQNPYTRSIPFIFLTGEANRSSFRKGMELGAEDFLTKPVTRQDLLEAIEICLKRREKLTALLKNQETNYVQVNLPTPTLLTDLELSRFEIFYQPQVNVQTNQIVGVEALLYWRHSEQELLPIKEISSITETEDVIASLGEQALYQACRQVRKWQLSYKQPLRLAMNLNRLQFKSQIVTRLQRILEQTDFPPNFLELEITENSLVSNLALFSEINQELKKLGVQLILENFGTGYSSLEYLEQKSFAKLKLGEVFVRNCDKRAKSRVIIQTMMNIAQSLDLQVVADGVKTNAEKMTLARNGCPIMQGELFAKVMSAQEFELWLQNSPYAKPAV